MNLRDVDHGTYIIGNEIGYQVGREPKNMKISGLCNCGEHEACPRFLFSDNNKRFGCTCQCHVLADEAAALEAAKRNRSYEDED